MFTECWVLWRSDNAEHHHALQMVEIQHGSPLWNLQSEWFHDPTHFTGLVLLCFVIVPLSCKWIWTSRGTNTSVGQGSPTLHCPKVGWNHTWLAVNTWQRWQHRTRCLIIGGWAAYLATWNRGERDSPKLNFCRWRVAEAEKEFSFALRLVFWSRG